MEVIKESRSRPTYYFSWPDQEILDDRTIALSCDDDTWLYKVESPNFNGHYNPGSPHQKQQNPSPSGFVDSRTFTRRKLYSLRPSLESVVESPLSNRSSLGILGESKLLNDTLTSFLTPQAPQMQESQERISSNFIVSDKKPLSRRVFKLDSPFTNTAIMGANSLSSNNYFNERARMDSESSDLSVPPSLENMSQFEKNEVMTDSLLNFLEKQENFCPPSAFQDNNPMTDSLVSIPEKNDFPSIGCLNKENNEQLTDSMINFLAPVNCKPPRGFEDNDMTSSLVNIDEKDILPSCDLTNSVMGYLQNNNCSSVKVVQRQTSKESENIPPNNCHITNEAIENHPNCTNRLKCNDNGESGDQLNSTFQKINAFNGDDEITNVTFTNNVNIVRKGKESGNFEDDLSNVRPLNTTFEKEKRFKDNNEVSFKIKALTSRDLNVTRDLNFEESNLATMLERNLKFDKTNSTTVLSNSKSSKTFIREDLSNTRQIPSRNSTFNTTFTKLQSQKPIKDYSHMKFSSLGATKSLNSTYNKSTEGLNGAIDDDQTSSASDSSFSSGSTKPRSVDELRTIAQQQESSLVQQTSTPTESTDSTSNFAKLDLELSPIRRMSIGANRNIESRSANCSPVRSPLPLSCVPHPISQLQKPLIESRRQTLQASSLSNIARPKVSGLRMPQPVSRFSEIAKSGMRPLTAPINNTTAIPRPQSSRLPMPRSRVSGIPAPKRTNLH